MTRIANVRWSALGIVLTLACASGGSSTQSANLSRFERNIGTGSPADILNKTDRIFAKYQFELFQRGDPPNLYVESKWRTRRPFDNEVAIGVIAAQTRAIVRGNPRGTASSLDIYTVNLTIENRVQRDASGTWFDNVATKQYQEFANQITADLKYELEIGVRR